MAIRINTENNEVEISDVATEDTLQDLLAVVEKLAGQQGKDKNDPEVKKTQEAIKKGAKATGDLTVALKDWAGNFDDTMEDLDKSLTERGKAISSALGQVVKNTGSAITDLIRGPASFENLGRALSEGAKGVGDVMGGVGDALKGIPGLGIAAGAAGGALKFAAAGAAAFATAIAALAQNYYDGFVALSQSGANYNADIVRTAAQINGLGLTLNSFTQIVQKNASSFATFGGSVALGTKRFVELAHIVHRDVSQDLFMLGVGFEEQAEQLAAFTQVQGRNTAFQNMSMAQQSILFKEYMGDLQGLVDLTGKQRITLMNEMAQMELRADANLRLQGSTEDARNAMLMVADTAGGEQGAVYQLLQAGVAGKSLAFEMAAGNQTIKNFYAGNSIAAEKIRDLGDAIATGQITQEQFHQGFKDLLPTIKQTGHEFTELYGMNEIATTMVQAASDTQELSNQFSNLGTGVDKETQAAEGTGGAIVALQATILDLQGSLKEATGGALADFTKALDLGDSKDFAANLKKRMASFDVMSKNIQDALFGIMVSFKNFATSMEIIGHDPLDWLMGGYSTNDMIDILAGTDQVTKAGGIDQWLGEKGAKDKISQMSNADIEKLIQSTKYDMYKPVMEKEIKDGQETGRMVKATYKEGEERPAGTKVGDVKMEAHQMGGVGTFQKLINDYTSVDRVIQSSVISADNQADAIEIDSHLDHVADAIEITEKSQKQLVEYSFKKIQLDNEVIALENELEKTDEKIADLKVAIAEDNKFWGPDFLKIGSYEKKLEIMEVALDSLKTKVENKKTAQNDLNASIDAVTSTLEESIEEAGGGNWFTRLFSAIGQGGENLSTYDESSKSMDLLNLEELFSNLNRKGVIPSRIAGSVTAGKERIQYGFWNGGTVYEDRAKSLKDHMLNQIAMGKPDAMEQTWEALKSGIWAPDIKPAEDWEAWKEIEGNAERTKGAASSWDNDVRIIKDKFDFIERFNKYSPEGWDKARRLAPGGTVSPTTPHWIGERGPELWSPGTGAGGMVTPFEQLATAEHSEDILKAIKEHTLATQDTNRMFQKYNELYGNLASEQVAKLDNLIKVSSTGNKIATQNYVT